MKNLKYPCSMEMLDGDEYRAQKRTNRQEKLEKNKSLPKCETCGRQKNSINVSKCKAC